MRKLLLISFLFFSTFSFSQTDLTVSGRSSIDPPETLTEITASPNPMTVKTRITFKSSKEQELTFAVKNLLGKIVYEERIDAKEGYNSIPFDRNNIAKGMYIYSLQTDTEIVSKRLVIR